MNHKYLIQKEAQGFTLIEILVSLVVIVLISTIAVSLGSGTLLDAQSNQDRSRALSYSVEGVELVRSIRDVSPQELFSILDGYYRLDTTSDPVLVAGSEPVDDSDYPNYEIGDSGYYRVLYLFGDTESKQVNVTTYYQEKEVWRSVDMVGYFTNWQ